ncbi:MAG: hypothetical protein GY757_10060 [bacterium]|nr:hypothetical protein [bacterium]
MKNLKLSDLAKGTDIIKVFPDIFDGTESDLNTPEKCGYIYVGKMGSEDVLCASRNVKTELHFWKGAGYFDHFLYSLYMYSGARRVYLSSSQLLEKQAVLDLLKPEVIRLANVTVSNDMRENIAIDIALKYFDDIKKMTPIKIDREMIKKGEVSVNLSKGSLWLEIDACDETDDEDVFIEVLKIENDMMGVSNEDGIEPLCQNRQLPHIGDQELIDECKRRKLERFLEVLNDKR